MNSGPYGIKNMGNEISLIYKELTYRINGILFGVFNELGYGYQEKYYQRAISLALKEGNVKYKEQVSVPIEFKGSGIGRYFFDFLIEDKIILEIKKGDQFYKKDITQTYAYLKSSGLKLGLLANFTKNGVKIKRIVNIHP